METLVILEEEKTGLLVTLEERDLEQASNKDTQSLWGNYMRAWRPVHLILQQPFREHLLCNSSLGVLGQRRYAGLTSRSS